MTDRPSVSVVIPTFQEEVHIHDCLAAVAAQTYEHVCEVLVVDGGSVDRTREIAAAACATVVDNPGRIQASALNIGIERAVGDVIVRVDGHCLLAADYVERCVEVLESTGASIVGGAMTPQATTATQRAVALAMSSPFGAGPARFHTGGDAAWVDTVYLGAYRTEHARAVGGYATDVGVNEDAEFAHRIGKIGGVRFDPSIRSSYFPRDSIQAVAKQFYRYGRSRAITVRRHPGSLSWRQLVAPALVIGLVSPFRKLVVLGYSGVLAAEAGRATRAIGWQGLRLAGVLPAMHLPWGLGMLLGLVRGTPTATTSASRPSGIGGTGR